MLALLACSLRVARLQSGKIKRGLFPILRKKSVRDEFVGESELPCHTGGQSKMGTIVSASELRGHHRILWRRVCSVAD